MRTTLIFITVAIASLLVACNKNSPPSSVSAQSESTAKVQSNVAADPVQQKLMEAAGAHATDCGRLKSHAPDQMQTVGECAMNAAKQKKPFYVAYDMPGLSVGVAGNSEGKLFSIQSEQSEKPGSQAEVKAVPCPSELRVAQSGRVTCMAPGSAMGAIGGGANPHGGMPPATGQSPHGGMMDMPALGTSNPHGTPKPSHPPASTTPPKQ
jgi:hypothetical protein